MLHWKYLVIHNLTAQHTEALCDTHWVKQNSQRNEPLGVCLFKAAIGTHVSASRAFRVWAEILELAVRCLLWGSAASHPLGSVQAQQMHCQGKALAGHFSLVPHSWPVSLFYWVWINPVSTSGIGVLELESLFSSFLTQSLASPIPPLQVTVALAQLQAFTPSALQHTLTVKPLYICKVKRMHT